MPSADQLLLNFSHLVPICNHSKPNLRLLMILSRVGSADQRQAIRETYLSVENYSAGHSLYANWSYFFLVGKPENVSEQNAIESESRKFEDLLSANVIEHYSNLTYKLLIGFKIASCFCPNAVYLVKTDDDTYLRIRKLDKVLIEQQNQVDGRGLKQLRKTKRTKRLALHQKQKHVSFYSGKYCSALLVHRQVIRLWQSECFQLFEKLQKLTI